MSQIPAGFALSNDATLVLRIDPRGLFGNVDFAQMKAVPGSDPPAYEIQDDASDQPSKALYSALRAPGDTYRFSIEAPQ